MRRARKRSSGSSDDRALFSSLSLGPRQVALLILRDDAIPRLHGLERLGRDLDVSTVDLRSSARGPRHSLASSASCASMTRRRSDSTRDCPLEVDQSLMRQPPHGGGLGVRHRRLNSSLLAVSDVTRWKRLSLSARRRFMKTVPLGDLRSASVSSLVFHSFNSLLVASIASFISAALRLETLTERSAKEGGKSVSGERGSLREDVLAVGQLSLGLGGLLVPGFGSG